MCQRSRRVTRNRVGTSGGCTVRHFTRVVIATVLLAGGFVFVDANPASAAVGNGTCDSGEFCVWKDANFTGCFRDWVPINNDYDWTNGSPLWNGGPSGCKGTGMNDKVTSVRNRSVLYTFGGMQNSNQVFWANAFCAHPLSSTGNLQNFYVFGGWNPNDSFSAHATWDDDVDCYYDDIN